MALLHRRDQAHRQAAAIWQRLAARERELVTTSLVVAETHGLIARRVGAEAGLAFLEAVLGGAGHRVVWVDQELAQRATERWLAGRRDRALSLTDAVGFEVMERVGIRQAFAFDQDFEAAGFAVIQP